MVSGMMMMGVAELSRAVRNRQISPVEATTQCLSRVEHLNDALGAFVTVDAERAMRAAAVAEGEVAIRAPMLGTFYRSPAPGEPPFVEIGKRVRADDTVCLIEVMKLFSSIKAGVDGLVDRILVENGSMIEFNQMLIIIATNR